MPEIGKPQIESTPDELRPTVEEGVYSEAMAGRDDFDEDIFKSSQRRIKNEAVRRNKSLLYRTSHLGAKSNHIDVAREEAFLENQEFDATHERVKVGPEQFDYKYSKEFQEWAGKLAVVIEKFKAKKEDPEGKGKDIKLAVVFMGGGMWGAYGAGVARALQKMGYGKYIDAIFGISAGAVYGSYLVGDQEVEASVYYDECCTDKFINFKRFSNIMGIDYLVDVITNSDKRLNQEAVMASKTQFFVQGTNNETGNPVLIDAKKAATKETGKSGLMASIYGSMCVPYFHARGRKDKGINVDSKEITDGGFDFMDLEEMIKKSGDNTFLIVPNFSFSTASSIKVGKGKWLLGSLTKDRLKRGILGFVTKSLKMDEGMQNFIDRVKNEKNVDVAFAWAPNLGISQLTTDPSRIRNAVITAGKEICSKFGEPKTKLDLP